MSELTVNNRAHKLLRGRYAAALRFTWKCCCLALALLLISCSSRPKLAPETQLDRAGASPSDYELVFIIHGDGGYIFHDSDGNAHRADEEALAGAIRVAERNSQAEVFIFHEKPRKHTLLIFPRRDGEFYYYRNGRLIARESYWRNQGPARFSPEIAFHQRFRSAKANSPIRMFLYFGHEIPEVGGTGYDASYKNRSFTIQDLVDGLRDMKPDSAKFDLVVLSTCFNGTPYIVSKLSPLARYVMASPGNLHLSYFDLQPFEALDVNLQNRDVLSFARNSAKQAYDRLVKDIQTEITIAVYDVDRVTQYVNSVDSIYTRNLAAHEVSPTTTMQRCDCAEDPAFRSDAMSEGIEVFFRPARFGRSAQKKTHSGWECPKLAN